MPDCYWGLGSLPESLNSNHCSEQLPEAEVARESPHVALCTNLEKHTATLMLNAQCLSLQQSLLKNGLSTSIDVFLCLLVPEANRRCLHPACFPGPLMLIAQDFHFDFRKICQVKLMISLTFCLTRTDNRSRIQIYFLCPSSLSVCGSMPPTGWGIWFFGAVFSQRDRIFFFWL